MPKGDGYGGRKAAAWVASVLATYGDRCHLCGHGGADSGDHLRTRKDRPDLMFVTENGRPVHHAPCPTCGRRCNVSRKDSPLEVGPTVNELPFFERTPIP